ncbi:MAG TPA: Hpt domain-containing protein [Phycisphaerales bacterium]|jgi:HPt (histidine-containing phosphotransfer) domain-containing protein|nr:Hpt domain-containing protein [Phycisphaerales bacterium]
MEACGNTSGRPIDVGVLLERCMDDAGLALRVLMVFQDQTSETLKGLERCASLSTTGTSVDEVARRAHALRGSAGAIGATGLFDVASKLEEAAHAGTISLTERLAGEVAAELKRCMDCVPSVKRELEPRASKG